MQLTHQERGKYLLIHARGRLDASWADHFADTLLDYIRQGHHRLLIDATDVPFLSSAGIRALLIVHKALLKVNGSFHILHATSFVSNTLSATGFASFLTEKAPADMPGEDAQDIASIPKRGENYVLDENASVSVSVPTDWQPWQEVEQNEAVFIRCTPNDLILGIGSSDKHFDQARSHFGEIMAVAGHLVHQPPGEGEHPDFMISEKDYVPEVMCIQVMHCSGKMSHLFRFAPTQDQLFFTIGEIAEMAIGLTGSDAVGFVIAAEIDGLVGSTLIRSPGLLEKGQKPVYPEIKEWMSFCGERVHAGQQALVFGLAVKQCGAVRYRMMTELPSNQHLSMHAHAAVFPYQPLQNGLIDLHEVTKQFFTGPPPIAMLHLLDDNRPAVGLGQSAFTRGACWCSPISNPEDLL